jgi:hypothetical protein
MFFFSIPFFIAMRQVTQGVKVEKQKAGVKS